MGLFSAPPPCETEVEKATNEKNASEEWSAIMEVCDKAGKSPQEAKDYLKAILKRINHPDPHVATQGVTLLDACVKNCGKTFHIEVASREFENEYQRLLKRSHPKVAQMLKDSLKRWAENEFKTDQQLNLIPSLYNKLKNSGTDFNTEEQPKRTITLSKDPNVVQSQEEEDQIAQAIELSLKDTSGSPRNSGVPANATSLYPSTNVAQAMALPPAKEPRKVRALYDFEAAEDNELTFSSGEIIFILDDSDPNWWKGSNQRGEGLFPANFVTNDLALDPDQLVQEKKKKLVQLDESLNKKLDEIKEPEVVEIDEGKIDRLLHLLHEADPTNPDHDTKEMLGLEKEVNSMGGLIDKELEKVDRKHAQLTQLSSDLVDALSLYHTLMREPQYPTIPMNKIPYQGYQPTSQPPNHSMMYNGTLPHQHQQAPPPSMSGGPPSMMSYDGRFMPPPQVSGMGGPYAPLPPPGLPQHRHMSPVSPPVTMSGPPQSLPPHGLNLPPPQSHMPDDPRLAGPFPPQGYNQMSYQGQHLHQTVLQNGPPGPQNGAFSMPPVSNTNIM